MSPHTIDHNRHTDSRIPGRDVCVLRYLVDRWAASQPDRIAMVFEDQSSWTYWELRDQVRRCASGLDRLGVRRGDRVAVWMPTGRDALKLFLCSKLPGRRVCPLQHRLPWPHP